MVRVKSFVVSLTVFLHQDDVERNHKWMKQRDPHLNHSVEDYQAALEILVDKNILHCDFRFNSDSRARYHLMRFWKAEEKIKDKLANIFDRHDQVCSQQHNYLSFALFVDRILTLFMTKLYESI